jgi:hypothetical protein
MDVEGPIDRFAELTVAHDVDAGFGLKPHRLRDRVGKARPPAVDQPNTPTNATAGSNCVSRYSPDFLAASRPRSRPFEWLGQWQTAPQHRREASLAA